MSKIIDLIECPDISEEIIVYRFPILNKEIRNGAQLIVKEGQVAVLVSNGQVGDVFLKGKHRLKTANLPVLAKLNAWSRWFKAPFKAEVYFISLTKFTNIKWGTPNPVIMRDDEFGMIRIRAFGNFSFRVEDPALFMQEIFGTINKFTPDDISSYLKTMVVAGFTDMVAETRIAALDLAVNYDKLSSDCASKLSVRFTKNGLKLMSLIIENISIPEVVENVVDKRTMVNVADMNTADSSKTKVGVSKNVGEAMREAYTAHTTPTINCTNCDAVIAKGLRFCPQCGKPNKESTKKCPKCHTVITFNAKFCPDCGTKLYDIENVITCKHCGRILDEYDKFCPDCGRGV